MLRCGVARPAALKPGSAAQFIAVDGVIFLPVQGNGDDDLDGVDRAVYFDVVVPASYPQPPLALIADAIAKALPAVCDRIRRAPTRAKLCTRRSDAPTRRRTQGPRGRAGRRGRRRGRTR